MISAQKDRRSMEIHGKLPEMRDLLRLGSLIVLASLGTACIDCIRGSGPVVREERTIDPFHAIQLETAARVFVIPGEDYSVAVETRESLLPYIETSIEDGELVIRSKECLWTGEEVYVFIKTPELSGASISGSGTIESEGVFETGEFEMGISGSGSILMQLDVDIVRVRISGSGDIRLEGIANLLNARISGSGDLRASELEVKEAVIKISGSGDASVNTIQQLDASIAGSGDVTYKGEPDVRFSVSGTGSVRKSE